VLVAKIDELERLHDWRSTVFGTRAPNPAMAARARKIPTRGTFRTSAIAKIRAYHYRHAYASGDAWDDQDPPFDPPYTKDGRLDGHVVPPEVLLEGRERERVLTMLRDAEEQERANAANAHPVKKPVLHCLFDAHHVLVFFDANDVPVGKMLICFTCGELLSVPGVAAFTGERPEAPAVMTTEQRDTLKEILDAHGLGAWTYDHDERARLGEYEERTYGDRVAPRRRERAARVNEQPSGVPADVTPRLATPEDHERFCVWARAEMWSRSRQREWPVTGSFACPSGQEYAFRYDDGASPPNACDAKHLCDVGYGRMEACLRASFLKGPDEICAHGPAPECQGLLSCLPYVSWGAATKR
jgi:hypothetical protein